MLSSYGWTGKALKSAPLYWRPQAPSSCLFATPFLPESTSNEGIQSENPPYLPQAKTYDGCASIGLGIYITKEPLPENTNITLEIKRNHFPVYKGSVAIKQMKRKLQELVSFLYRECSFPYGSLLMTGTGIVPPNDFALHSDDQIAITIDPIGTLINTVE